MTTLEQFIRGESGEGVAESLTAVKPEVHTMPVYGGRCPECPISELGGTICDYPGFSELCPACAGQTPAE